MWIDNLPNWVANYYTRVLVSCSIKLTNSFLKMFFYLEFSVRLQLCFRLRGKKYGFRTNNIGYSNCWRHASSIWRMAMDGLFGLAWVLCIKHLTMGHPVVWRPWRHCACNQARAQVQDTVTRTHKHIRRVVSGLQPPGQLIPGQLPPRTIVTQDSCHPDNWHRTTDTRTNST